MSALSTPLVAPAVPPALPPGVSLSRKILGGVSSLGAAAAIERGLSFLANLCAARLGGAATFGSYALALTTANNIASYAGAGIGSTAARFSGQYANDALGRRALGPRSGADLDQLRGACRGALAGGRRAVRLAAHGCCTTRVSRRPACAGRRSRRPRRFCSNAIAGFLLGQQRFRLLICLSVCVGLGYVAVLPLASRSGAVVMVVGLCRGDSVAALLAVLAWQISNGRREEHVVRARGRSEGVATGKSRAWRD